MPFESKKQMRWMFAAEERGEVPKGTAKKWLKHTKKPKNLPEEKKKEAMDKIAILQVLRNAKEAKEARAKFAAAAGALQGQGIDQNTIDQLLVQLSMLQHHIDDAEVYGGIGQQDAAHLSLDDAEENVERVAEKTLPPAKAGLIEEVAEQGDEEEVDAGVEEVGHSDEKEAAANDAFEIGMRYTFHKQGFDNFRIDALVDVAKAYINGNVKTAADIQRVMLPHVLAESIKTGALLAAPNTSIPQK